MIRLMPDIALHASKYTAESWAFWMTWLAPYLLEGRLPDEHYQHLLLFSKVIKISTKRNIDEEAMTELESDVKAWHAKYEE
jgi:hypothetical protein